MDYGAIQGILELLDRIKAKSKEKYELMKVLTWVLSNLCRGKPIPRIEKVQDAIPFFSVVI